MSTQKRIPTREDFEFIYRRYYPRKAGKSKGLLQALKYVKDIEAFTKAVKKYRAECERDGTEPRFIKHFSSFVGTPSTGHPWEDYLDEDCGEANVRSIFERLK